MPFMGFFFVVAQALKYRHDTSVKVPLRGYYLTIDINQL